MHLPEYIRRHPDRLKHFHKPAVLIGDDETSDSGEMQTDSSGQLLDVHDVCNLVTSYEGPAFRNPAQSMLSYLRSARALYSSYDEPEKFAQAYDSLAESYASKTDYRESADNPLPFFVSPEAVFGFVRYHLRFSPMLYGQPVTLQANLWPANARSLIEKSLNKLHEVNALAWWLAINDVSLRLQQQKVVKEFSDPRSHLIVKVQVGVSTTDRVRLNLSAGETNVSVPSIEEIIRHPKVAELLPKFQL